MTRIVTNPEHGAAITAKGDPASDAMQLFIDDLAQRLNDNLLGQAMQLPTYTVTEANALTISPAGGMIYVTDEAGGAVAAVSDGTNWRRTTDRAIVTGKQ